SVTRARRMSRPAKAGATDEVRSAPPTPLWRCLSSPPKAGGFTAAAPSADRAMRAGRVPRMPRWLRQPRHGSRAWYCRFTLASGSDPRHESRVALLAPRRGAAAAGPSPSVRWTRRVPVARRTTLTRRVMNRVHEHFVLRHLERQLEADVALDRLEALDVVLAREADRVSGCAGAGRAADAMHVV